MSLQKIRGHKVGGYLPERDIFSGVYSKYVSTNYLWHKLYPEAT